MADVETHTDNEEHGQQHPIGVYVKIWVLLFVLSAFSYAVDWYQLEGMLRWSLILIFMMLKAGFIVAIFMHMMWERMALITIVILPPLAILVLVAFMVLEADYVNLLRTMFMGGNS